MSKTKTVVRERGTALSLFLIYVAAHGLLFTYLTWSVIKPRDASSPAWMLWLLLLLSIADVVSAVALWYWKKWGFQLFVVTTMISIAVGLVATATQLWVFYAIIPLAILGYLMQGKWQQFE
jgi:hypothetical protein